MENSHDMTTNSRVAYLCANLFFSEFIECTLPLLMTAMSTAIFYLSDNCEYVEYMRNKPEEQFRVGILYTVIDSVLEIVIFVLIIFFLKRVVDVSILRLGIFVIRRHVHYFFWMTIGACMFFQDIFLLHVGTDTSFEFKWLSGDFEFNATKIRIDEGLAVELGERCYRPDVE